MALACWELSHHSALNAARQQPVQHRGNLCHGTRSHGGAEIKRGVITIKKFMDNPARKIVAALTDDNKLYELWKDAAYDAIGDWTTAQAVARVKELAEAGNAGA